MQRRKVLPGRSTRHTPRTPTGKGASLFSVLGVRVSGFGFRVPGFGIRDSGFGFRVSGFGFRDSRSGFRVSGSGSGFQEVEGAGGCHGGGPRGTHPTRLRGYLAHTKRPPPRANIGP